MSKLRKIVAQRKLKRGKCSVHCKSQRLHIDTSLGKGIFHGWSPLPLHQMKFCESSEGVRLPRQRADLGKSGELPGKSGELPGNLWIAVKFHSERTSGEVAGELPEKFWEFCEVQGLSRSSGGLPATRQICLQLQNPKKSNKTKNSTKNSSLQLSRAKEGKHFGDCSCRGRGKN